MAISSIFSLQASDNQNDLSEFASWPEHERRKNIALRRLRGILETEADHAAEADDESDGSKPQPLG